MPAQTKRILIVEDEKPLARVLENKLVHIGFEVKSVFDGEAALSLLAQEKFDLIVLDLVMPKTDGFGVLAKLKTFNIQTPVIVTSNLSQEEDLKKAKELGAKDYFIKSDIPLAEIVERVKKVLADKT